MSSDTLEQIPIQFVIHKHRVAYNPSHKFCYGYHYNNSIVISPLTYPAFLQYDINTKEISYHEEWVDKIEQLMGEVYSNYYLGDGFVRLNDSLYFPLACYGGLLTINLKTMSFGLKTLACPMDCYEGIAYENDVVYLTGRKECEHFLIIWKYGTDEIERIKIPFEGCNEWISFLRPLIFNNKVYILPFHADHCYVVMLGSREVRIENNIDDIMGVNDRSQDYIQILNYKIRNNNLIFQTKWDYKWHELNLVTGDHIRYFIRLEDEMYWKRYHYEKCIKQLSNSGMVKEDYIPLNTFVEAVLK